MSYRWIARGRDEGRNTFRYETFGDEEFRGGTRRTLPAGGGRQRAPADSM